MPSIEHPCQPYTNKCIPVACVLFATLQAGLDLPRFSVTYTCPDGSEVSSDIDFMTIVEQGNAHIESARKTGPVTPTEALVVVSELVFYAANGQC
jgi:hypothetical protein